MVLSQSEGLGKTALRIVKYAYDRSTQLISVIWFTDSCCGPAQLIVHLIGTGLHLLLIINFGFIFRSEILVKCLYLD